MDSLLTSFEKMNLTNGFQLPYIKHFNELDPIIKNLISDDFMNICERFFEENETDILLDINIGLINKMDQDMYIKMFFFLAKNGYKIFEIIIKEIAYKKYKKNIEDINIFTLYNNYMDLMRELIKEYVKNIKNVKF